MIINFILTRDRIEAMDKSVQSVAFTDQVLLHPPAKMFTNTTVLSRAIEAGSVDDVSKLLEMGCDPNLPCGLWGMRPLMVAQYVNSKARKQQLTRLLLQFGAVPSLTDNDNRNCLMYACALKSCDAVSAILQASEYDFYASDCDGNTLVHWCAMVGDPTILNIVLEYALKYRCDLNSRNKHSLTGLLVAILRQRKECAVILHERGATPRFTATDFQSIVQAMDPEVESDMQVYRSIHNDLLLRVISDVNCIHKVYQAKGQLYDTEYLKVVFQRHSKMHLKTPSCDDEKQKWQHSQSRSVEVGSTVDCVHTSNEQHTSDYMTDPDIHARLRRCATAPQSPSSMESISDLLSRSYHIRRSASYCNSSVRKSNVCEEWVDTIIRNYQCGEQCQSEPLQQAEANGDVKRLGRTISSPSNGDLQPACQNQQPTTTSRPKSLTRSTTSPHFFSQPSIA